MQPLSGENTWEEDRLECMDISVFLLHLYTSLSFVEKTQCKGESHNELLAVFSNQHWQTCLSEAIVMSRECQENVRIIKDRAAPLLPGISIAMSVNWGLNRCCSSISQGKMKGVRRNCKSYDGASQRIGVKHQVLIFPDGRDQY